MTPIFALVLGIFGCGTIGLLLWAMLGPFAVILWSAGAFGVGFMAAALYTTPRF